MPEASSYAVNSELSLSNQFRVLSSPWWRLSGPRKPSLHQRCHPSGLVGGSREQQTLCFFDRRYKRSQRPNNRKTVCSSDQPWKTGLPDRPPCPLYQRPLHQSREKRQTALKCHILLKAYPKFLGQRCTLLYPLIELCLHALAASENINHYLTASKTIQPQLSWMPLGHRLQPSQHSLLWLLVGLRSSVLLGRDINSLPCRLLHRAAHNRTGARPGQGLTEKKDIQAWSQDYIKPSQKLCHILYVSSQKVQLKWRAWTPGSENQWLPTTPPSPSICTTGMFHSFTRK